MSSDGKQLEGLVLYVEKTLLAEGYDVKTNERVYNDEGIQIAEFDIEIRGKVGSTTIAWLIECRDRPGHGPAPGSWIEQLVGRRTRFGFNKVTAVSTTGFAAGAVEFARAQGIELREVQALAADQFADWLIMRHIQHVEEITKLDHASILINKGESENCRVALSQFISSQRGDAKFLRSTKSGELISTSAAFLGAVSAIGTLFDDLKPNGPSKQIKLHVQYSSDEDHFVIDTAVGPVRVEEIIYSGELCISERLIPLSVTAEYRHAEAGEQISQVASFAPQAIHGMSFSLEMHRIAETGVTHVVLRRLKYDA